MCFLSSFFACLLCLLRASSQRRLVSQQAYMGPPVQSWAAGMGVVQVIGIAALASLARDSIGHLKYVRAMDGGDEDKGKKKQDRLLPRWWWYLGFVDETEWFPKKFWHTHHGCPTAELRPTCISRHASAIEKARGGTTAHCRLVGLTNNAEPCMVSIFSMSGPRMCREPWDDLSRRTH